MENLDLQNETFKLRNMKNDLKTISDEVITKIVRTVSTISDNQVFDSCQNSSQSPSLSYDSSIPDEISFLSEIGDIRQKNSELRSTGKDIILNFKRTSKDFLSKSVLDSKNRRILLTELEEIKCALNDRLQEIEFKDFTFNVILNGNSDSDLKPVGRFDLARPGINLESMKMNEHCCLVI